MVAHGGLGVEHPLIKDRKERRKCESFCRDDLRRPQFTWVQKKKGDALTSGNASLKLLRILRVRG